MSISKEAKRVRFGSSVIDAKNQIESSFSVLKSIKANLANMISDMEQDTTSFNKDDCDEVRAVLTYLTNKISL